jgi:hypothetical protein
MIIHQKTITRIFIAALVLLALAMSCQVQVHVNAAGSDTPPVPTAAVWCYPPEGVTMWRCTADGVAVPSVFLPVVAVAK